MHSVIITSLNKHAPEKNVQVKGRYKQEPWLTNGILKSMRKQKLLYKKSINLDGQAVTTQSVQKYKDYRATLQRVKRFSKMKYYQDECNNLKRNTKKLWNLINTVIKKKTNKHEIIECLEVENLKIEDSKQIANEFAKHFASIGMDYAKKISVSDKGSDHYMNKIAHNKASMFLMPTDPHEINKLIGELPNKNSSGYDDISNMLLKKIGPSIVEPLARIFNNSFTEGVFPNSMKLADVVPLFKNKKREHTNNYRPISLLITISKLLEKLIYKRTYSFLEKHELIYKSQYGFRSNHSCEQAVNELIGEIAKSKENGKITAAIFLDLSKAFDTLNHPLLLRKLERYGIRGNTLKWFESYLSNRSLRAKVSTSNGITYSDTKEINYGTPQGSCLGPLLFLIFTNDLHLNLEFCECILFADDTTIYYSGTHKRLIEWCLQSDLKTLQDWFRANTLTLNINKSVVMSFDPKKKIKT